MAENLAYLPKVFGPTSGSENDGQGFGAKKEAYYYVYDYDGTNIEEAKKMVNYQIFGVLYNLQAAKNACPTGWHLPNQFEWEDLVKEVGKKKVRGGNMKETGTAHWMEPNSGATNESGFTGLPGGFRLYNGSFAGIGYQGRFWCDWFGDSTASFWTLYSEESGIYSLNHYDFKDMGLSVRCLKY
ncbi:MAG: FISUMP domain-containing protein [Candidatus Paceibacterota bacterium]|jgi:uncharacterized protein (TIGR02145 family)|nr:FISUMP domain-containing protein [Bacteroidales bacterium]